MTPAKGQAKEQMTTKERRRAETQISAELDISEVSLSHTYETVFDNALVATLPAMAAGGCRRQSPGVVASEAALDKLQCIEAYANR